MPALGSSFCGEESPMMIAKIFFVVISAVFLSALFNFLLQKKHYRDAISGNAFVSFECDCEICQKINRLRGTTNEK